MAGDYFNHAYAYGQAMIAKWLDAAEQALDDFKAQHEGDKNWKDEFYANLIASGVSYVFRPLVGPLDATLEGAVKKVAKEAIATIESAVSQELSTQLQLSEAAGGWGLPSGERRYFFGSRPVAGFIFGKMRRGLNDARDYFVTNLSYILAPIESPCRDLLVQTRGECTPEGRHRVQGWVDAILPCGSRPMNQIADGLREGLETIWSQYVQWQMTLSQRLLRDGLTPPSFVPAGGWEYTISFRELRAKNGQVGARRGTMFLIPMGDCVVKYAYVVTFRYPGTAAALDVHFDGQFTTRRDNYDEAMWNYRDEQHRVRELWAKLMRKYQPLG
jgi:hypothetical protein